VKKKKLENPLNSESIDQWLARGGRIQKVDFSDAYNKFLGFGGKNREARKNLPRGVGLTNSKKVLEI
jgi:hypothetical protein